MRRVATLLLLGLVAGCGGGGDGPGGAPASPAAGRGDGRGGDPVEHLRALQRIADRSDGVRSAGTPGDQRTIEYIARTLVAAGWRVDVQRFRFRAFERQSPERLSGLRRGRDFRAAEYSGSGRVRARVRRVEGRGCRASDYDALRQGEIALAERGSCYFTDKARLAARAGAAALLADDVYGRTPVSATLLTPGRIPVLIVTDPAARRVAGTTVSLRVDARTVRRETANVLAETARRPDGRWLMAGGHHDSVTAGPGINDDGSGISALLALAERRRRTPGLRFAFWAGEELGLYGSRHYVRSLSLAERGEVSGYVNLDMIGSPNGRVSVYDRDDAIERALRRAIPGPEGELALRDASDHAPFEKAGIPVGGIFTGASDRGRRPGPADGCYHRSCDTLRNVDLRLMRRLTDAADRALRALAR
jgi:peptidase M28-like protein/PA domain-containing protein